MMLGDGIGSVTDPPRMPPAPEHELKLLNEHDVFRTSAGAR